MSTKINKILPSQDYLVFSATSGPSSLILRKISGGKDIGIRVEKENYGFPSHTSTETFIDREAAKELISSLQKYFNL